MNVSYNLFNYFVLDIPNCGNYPDCNSCAKVSECAWCASEGTCTSISTAFTKDCGGLVFELPCPDSFVNGIVFTYYFSQCFYYKRFYFKTENVVVGNLIVRADPTFGGAN